MLKSKKIYYWLKVIFIAIFISNTSQANVIASPREDKIVFKVEEYGAVGDGITDCTAAIQKAIQAAVDCGKPSIVQFGEGTYIVRHDRERLNSTEAFVGAITVENANNLTLQGVYNTLIKITDGYKSGIIFKNGNNISLKNLTIDYDTLPFTQGVIEAVYDDGTFDFRIQEGYPQFDNPCITKAERYIGFTMKEDGANEPYYSLLSYAFVTKWVQKAPNVWNLNDANKTFKNNGIKPGTPLIFTARKYSESAVIMNQSKDVLMENVTINASPGVATLWMNNENVTIRKLQIKKLPGRLLSTNADGIHQFGTRGKVIIENCSFEGMGDDGINIHCRHGRITAVEGSTITVDRIGELFTCRVGDTLQIMDRVKNKVRGEAVVSNLSTTPDNKSYIITLASPINGITIGITDLNSDAVFNLDACSAGAVIRNNKFGEFRGRGILLRSKDVIIENNIFATHDSMGVSIHSDNSGEGPVGRNINIRKNTFKYSEVNVKEVKPVQNSDGLFSAKDIFVQDNIFEGTVSSILNVEAAENVCFSQNIINNSLLAKKYITKTIGRRVFNVEEYGAVGDGKTNCTTAVSNAIQDAINCGEASVVKFGKGTYLVGYLDDKNESEPGSALRIKNAVNFTLEGEGSNTVIAIPGGYKAGIEFEGGKGVALKNLSIEYSKWKDEKPDRWKTEDIGSKIPDSKEKSEASIEDMEKTHSRYALIMNQNKDVLLENIFIDSVLESKTLWTNNENITIRGSQVKNQHGKAFAFGQDDFRVYGTRGKIQIENCIYEYKELQTLLSQGKTVTASAYNGNGYSPANAVDGNNSTYWCAPNGTFSQWIKVDLGDIHTLSSFIQIFNNNAAWKYKIEVSTDNQTYFTVIDNTSIGFTGTELFEVIEPTQARYIRFTITSGSQWATSKEFHVFGTE